jgi:hypothetical protein
VSWWIHTDGCLILKKKLVRFLHSFKIILRLSVFESCVWQGKFVLSIEDMISECLLEWKYLFSMCITGWNLTSKYFKLFCVPLCGLKPKGRCEQVSKSGVSLHRENTSSVCVSLCVQFIPLCSIMRRLRSTSSAQVPTLFPYYPFWYYSPI